MPRFYWSLGRDIVAMKAEQKWGSKIVNQMSLDLRQAFPQTNGFSVTNIKYATRWYLFYNQDIVIGQRVVDQFVLFSSRKSTLGKDLEDALFYDAAHTKYDENHTNDKKDCTECRGTKIRGGNHPESEK